MKKLLPLLFLACLFVGCSNICNVEDMMVPSPTTEYVEDIYENQLNVVVRDGKIVETYLNNIVTYDDSWTFTTYYGYTFYYELRMRRDGTPVILVYDYPSLTFNSYRELERIR